MSGDRTAGGVILRISGYWCRPVSRRAVTWCDWLTRLTLGFRSIAGAVGRGWNREDCGARAPGRVGVGPEVLRGSGVESEMELAYASLSPGAVDTEMFRTANPNFARSSRASIVRPRGPASGRCCSARPDASGQRVQLIGHVAGAEDVRAAWQRSSTSSPFDTPAGAPANWGRPGSIAIPATAKSHKLRYPRSAGRRRCWGSRPGGWVGGSSGFAGGIGHCTDWPEVRVIGSPWWWMSSVSPVSRV